jgi:mutator protein MutT
MEQAATSASDHSNPRSAILRPASLCLLLREGEVLLALKKRGFGQGKWTGVGGKPEPGETIDQTAVRETEEEIGVTPLAPRQVATLDFIFPDQPRFAGWSMQVFVYLADRWLGEPIETEEVAPRWFRRDAIPYPGMWSDAPYWLPPVLRGHHIRAKFHFDEEQRVARCAIIEQENGRAGEQVT